MYRGAPTLSECASALRRGELVVMPTETVYGLAANALAPAAVARIFSLKGRPANNPLIVHTDDPMTVATEISSDAQKLMDAFWPGPLTLVLPKRPDVPDAVTAGLPTVAVRFPAHPLAQDLIRESGLPLAAPSANRFTEVSPTRAEDVSDAIRAGVFAVLDGGPCDVGIESTIISLVGEPTVLRLGQISREQIEACLAREIGVRLKGDITAPGMHPRHYSPTTPIRLVAQLQPGEEGIRLTDPIAFAHNLYAELHRLDRLGLAEILIEEPPKTREWDAIWDRLNRATHP